MPVRLCSPLRPPLFGKVDDAILHAAKPGDQAFQFGALHHYLNASGYTRALVEQNRQSTLSAINSRAHLFTIGQQRRDLASHGCTNGFIQIH